MKSKIGFDFKLIGNIASVIFGHIAHESQVDVRHIETNNVPFFPFPIYL